MLSETPAATGQCPSAPDPNPPADQNLTACRTDDSTRYELGPAFLTNANIEHVQAGQPFQGSPAGYQVNLAFDEAGTDSLAAVSAKLALLPSPRNEFAIVVDGTVYSAPYFEQAILGGQAQISGDFTRAQAEELAAQLQP